MAILHAESWDACPTSTAIIDYNGYVQGWGPGAVQAGGRFGNGYFASDPRHGLGRAIAGAPSTIGAGFALWWNALVDNQIFWRFSQGGNTQIDLRQGTGQTIILTRNGTVLATSAPIMTNSVWHYLEIKAVIHDTTGSVVVKLDGVMIISVTGADTKATANAWVDQWDFCGVNQGNIGYSIACDDLVIWDGVDQSIAQPGSLPNNNFLGDVRVEAILPSGNGNSSVLLGSDSNSTDNYLLVDEAQPNGDTDYVSSVTPGDKDTYAMGNVTPTAGTVYAVVPKFYARKDDAGTRSVVSVLRSAGAETDGPAHGLTSTYQGFEDVSGADPSGAAWTIASVNAMEAGIKVNA